MSCHPHIPMFSRTEMSSPSHQSCSLSLDPMANYLPKVAHEVTNYSAVQFQKGNLNRGTNKVQTPDQVSLGTELLYPIKVHLSLKYAFFEGGTPTLCQRQFLTNVTSIVCKWHLPKSKIMPVQRRYSQTKVGQPFLLN